MDAIEGAAAQAAPPAARARGPHITPARHPRIDPQGPGAHGAMPAEPTLPGAPPRTISRQATQRSEDSIGPLTRHATFDSTASVASRRCGWFCTPVFASPSSSVLMSSVHSLRRRPGSNTGQFQMASSFVDGLMVQLDFHALAGLPKPPLSDRGLEAVMEAFHVPDDFCAFYDAALKTDGHTGRGKDPLIGPSAFDDVVRASGIGEDCVLDDDMVALAVALTIGHEGTHSRQWERYPAVDLEGREDALACLPPTESEPIVQACERQKHLLEALAYQCEVFNLQAIAKALPLPPGKLAQLKALQDTAIYRRDEHIDALTGEAAYLLLRGDVDGAMSLVLDGVPAEWISAPLSGRPWPGGSGSGPR